MPFVFPHFIMVIAHIKCHGGSGRENRKKRVHPKKWCLSNNFFYALFSATPSFLLSSHEALIILQQATKKTHLRAHQCIWDNYVTFAQKYYNPITCQYWLFIHTCVPKNAIVSEDAISTTFDITWCAEAAIYSNNLVSHFIVCYF